MGTLNLTITHPGIVGDLGKADVAQLGAMLIHVATEIGYDPPTPGQTYRKPRRIQGELIGAVYIYEEGSES